MAKEKISDNNVHVNGYVNSISANELEDGKKAYNLNVVTRESYQDEKKEWQNKDTYHKVNVITDNKRLIKSIEKAIATIENNNANRLAAGGFKKGFKPEPVVISVDGKLITRKNEKDGITFNNMLIAANNDTIAFSNALSKDETKNKAEFKGNVSKIDIKEGFAIVSIAEHFYIPGSSVNAKGEEKNYEKATNFIETRISGKRFPDLFKKLENGDIAVGDLIKVSGQMHNSSYADEKNDVTRYKIAVDLTNIDVIAKKKAEKVEAKAEVKAKAAPAKKQSNKKGRSL